MSTPLDDRILSELERAEKLRDSRPEDEQALMDSLLAIADRELEVLRELLEGERNAQPLRGWVDATCSSRRAAERALFGDGGGA